VTRPPSGGQGVAAPGRSRRPALLLAGTIGWLAGTGPLLERARRLFLLFSLVQLGLLVPFLVVSQRAVALRVPAGVGMVFLVARWRHGYRHQRFHPALEPAEGIALLLVTASISRPFQALGLLYVGLYFRCLYGTGREVVVVLASYLAAFLGGLSVAAGPASLLAGPVVAQVPTLALAAATMHALSMSVVKQQAARDREEALSRASDALLAATSADEVCLAAIAGVQELLPAPLTPRVSVYLDTGTGLRLAAGSDPAVAAVRPSMAAGLPAAVLAAATTGQAVLMSQVRRARADNRPAVWWAHPLLVHDVVGGVVFVSLRATPEPEVTEALGTLVGEVRLALERAGLAVALEAEHEAAEQLRQLGSLQRTLLEAVSHELRTPLTTVLGGAVTLQRLGPDLASEVGWDLVRRVVINARRLDRLLGDLLDLNRLDRGMVALERAPVDLGALAGEVVARTEELVGRHVEVDAAPVIIAGDRLKIERVIANLLLNAAKYTNPQTTIWVRVAPLESGALLVVEDAGPGVPAALKHAIFEPFQQGSTPSPNAAGVGLGLSLVVRFVAMHGGRVWVEDRIGGGASFRVVLPAETDPAPR